MKFSKSNILKNGMFEFDIEKFKDCFQQIADERQWSERATKAQWTRCLKFESVKPEIKSNGREMNELNTMLREARKYVTCEGERCVEVDLKSCFVTLLTTQICGKEFVQWKALLGVGFYERVSNKMRISIDEAKLQVSSYIGGMQDTRFELEIMNRHFPQFAEFIRQQRELKGKNAVVLYCTKLEGQIVLGAIDKLNVPSKSLHDGIFCRESDKELVKAALVLAGREVLGFSPRVEIK